MYKAMVSVVYRDHDHGIQTDCEFTRIGHAEFVLGDLAVSQVLPDLVREIEEKRRGRIISHSITLYPV